MPNLFAYGTLMCDEIMLEVSEQTIVGQSALLLGYSRRAVLEQPFPALIEQQNDQVQGMLFRGITEQAWQRLDRFEGHMYARHSVSVQLSSSETSEALAYIMLPAYRARVSDELWDYERFLKEGRQRFESSYSGYKAI